MKIYDWKTFLFCIIIGGAGAFYTAIQWARGNGMMVFWLLLSIVVIVGGIRETTNEEAYREAAWKEETTRRLYREQFGKWAPFMPFGALGFFVLALVVVSVIPQMYWIGFLLVVAGLVYQLRLVMWLRRGLKEEKQKNSKKK